MLIRTLSMVTVKTSIWWLQIKLSMTETKRWLDKFIFPTKMKSWSSVKSIIEIPTNILKIEYADSANLIFKKMFKIETADMASSFPQLWSKIGTKLKMLNELIGTLSMATLKISICWLQTAFFNDGETKCWLGKLVFSPKWNFGKYLQLLWRVLAFMQYYWMMIGHNHRYYSSVSTQYLCHNVHWAALLRMRSGTCCSTRPR